MKRSTKLGVQWDISNDIRLRAAYLRTLKRQLVVDQTIEPTQVAGFNQFLDDFNGTRAELYGIGLDTKLTKNAYAGFEFSRRNLDVPIVGLIDQEKEDSYRAYVYWTPHSSWALSAEYRFEHFGGKIDIGLPTKLDTTSIPLSVRYFSPLGIFSEIGATFGRQEVGRRGIVLTPDSDEFYIVDAAIGYRLPKRRGIVTLEIRNLLDEKFLFEDSEFRTSDPFSVTREFIPDRAIMGRITLNFF